MRIKLHEFVANFVLLNCHCWTNPEMSVMGIVQGHAATATTFGGIGWMGTDAAMARPTRSGTLCDE